MNLYKIYGITNFYKFDFEILPNFRIRTNSRHADKGVNGGLVYDDIPIAASLRSPRGRDADRATYKTAPISDPIIGGSTHVYVPEPRSAPPSEHFYQTISSGK